MRNENRIHSKLTALYGDVIAQTVYEQLTHLLMDAPESTGAQVLAVSERDTMLIAYGDHVRRAGEPPLATLHETLARLRLPVSSLHILPFYPYSSDDGFSVIDYYRVDPALGAWDDVRRLAGDYRLMFDAVFNHISAESDWFRAFLRGEAPYTGYFVTADADADVSLVTRPRTHPLLTRFATARGDRYVWTTFSDDQIDLNVANPAVLIELVRALLFYVRQGAQFIRLDAIAFLWKELGTSCIHLPQTHLIVQLLRDILDVYAPTTILITETNVPHEENLSYFGDGTDEAQLVYQFALPPLIMHTLRTGSAERLTAWAATIRRVSERTTFFNFTASHDGIGIRPVMDILSGAEIDALVRTTLEHGGRVSMKSNADGTQSPYELNITYFDAITAPEITAAQPEIAVQRFLLSQAIMLAMIGIPGIYFPSLFGSRNDDAGVQATGRNRTINREKLNADALLRDIERDDTITRAVFERYARLLAVRTSEPAFHPLGAQAVLDISPAVFAVERASPDGQARVLALHNVSDQPQSVSLPVGGAWLDLFNQAAVDVNQPVLLAPYQFLWLKAL